MGQHGNEHDVPGHAAARARPAAGALKDDFEMKNDLKLGADETLRGAAPMAAYYTELLGEKVEPKTVYYWFARGYIPGGKFAGVLTSTKTMIREGLAATLRAAR
jgi:hypothetical protein